MSIRAALVLLVALASWVHLTRGDEVPVDDKLAQLQRGAQAFGVFFGGMATQFDLCVKKGFLPKPKQSAEATAQSVLEKMR